MDGNVHLLAFRVAVHIGQRLLQDTEESCFHVLRQATQTVVDVQGNINPAAL